MGPRRHARAPLRRWPGRARPPPVPPVRLEPRALRPAARGRGPPRRPAPVGKQSHGGAGGGRRPSLPGARRAVRGVVVLRPGRRLRPVHSPHLAALGGGRSPRPARVRRFRKRSRVAQGLSRLRAPRAGRAADAGPASSLPRDLPRRRREPHGAFRTRRRVRVGLRLNVPPRRRGGPRGPRARVAGARVAGGGQVVPGVRAGDRPAGGLFRARAARARRRPVPLPVARAAARRPARPARQGRHQIAGFGPRRSRPPQLRPRRGAPDARRCRLSRRALPRGAGGWRVAPALLALYLVLISALTLPHVVVVLFMDYRQGLYGDQRSAISRQQEP